MSDKRQSVSNYVYNKRRNTNSEPVHNANDFDFTSNNTQNQNNSSPSMYNSYVSENDYNSYTSGYQSVNTYQNSNTFNSQPQQNSYNNFNNYSQPPQNNYNNFNNYNQPPQNNFNNFNNYSQPIQQNHFNNNQSVWQTDFGSLNNRRNQPVQQNQNYSNNAIEVPLPNKMSLSSKILLIAFAVMFLSMLVLAILSSAIGWNGDSLTMLIVGIFVTGFITIAGSAMLGSWIDRRHDLRVCNTQVKGRLVGYERRRRSGKHRRYSVYAPKYEVYVNNRYEIRTVNDFERGQTWGNEINLLVNPSGYEAVPATRDDYPKRSAGEWISALVLAVFIILIFGYPLLMMFQSM